jgi:acetyl esterase/lipase
MILSSLPALTDQAPHPAQRDAFLNGYKYLLNEGIPASNVIFMGDSAGGKCSKLMARQLLM